MTVTVDAATHPTDADNDDCEGEGILNLSRFCDFVVCAWTFSAQYRNIAYEIVFQYSKTPTYHWWET